MMMMWRFWCDTSVVCMFLQGSNGRGWLVLLNLEIMGRELGCVAKLDLTPFRAMLIGRGRPPAGCREENVEETGRALVDLVGGS